MSNGEIVIGSGGPRGNGMAPKERRKEDEGNECNGEIKRNFFLSELKIVDVK